MKRPSAPPETGDLLNLPLAPAASDDGELTVEPQQELLPLEARSVTESGGDETLDHPTSRPSRNITGSRLQAGLLDFTAVAGSVFIAASGARLLGVEPDSSALPALVAFGLAFSFLYHVVPLAFWGQSPGMLATAVVARAADGSTLTMRQVLLRWLGALLTAVGLGLPLVLLASGRSLADRLSASRVRPA